MTKMIMKLPQDYNFLSVDKLLHLIMSNVLYFDSSKNALKDFFIGNEAGFFDGGGSIQRKSSYSSSEWTIFFALCWQFCLLFSASDESMSDIFSTSFTLLIPYESETLKKQKM